MGNSRPARENHGRKHRLAQKPQWGSTVFKAFVACVTAFALMVPATTLIAIAADDDGGFNSQPTDVGTPSTDDKDASKSKDSEDKDASKSSESAESKDSADKSKEAEGKDASKSSESADKSKASEDQDASKSSESADKSKEAEDKDASKSSESAESKDSADNSKEAEGKDASKSSESADKSKGAKKMPAQSFKKELTTENDKKITVSVEAPEGAFPEGTTMKVKAVEASEVEDAVKSAVSEKTSEKVTEMQAVDITFYNKDGKEIEPAKEITVKFVSDLIKKDDEPLIVHVDDEGDADVVKPLSDDELKDRDKKVKENELLIDSDKFSVYVLACTTMITTDVLTADGKTYKITVTCDEDAQIPEGSKLVVKEILADNEKYLDYLSQATEALKKDDDTNSSAGISYARLFDIEIHDEADEKIEPSAPVQVKIDLADKPETEQNALKVVHFEGDEETPVMVETKADKEADVCFEAESFSAWAVFTVPPNVTDLDGLTATISRDYGGQNNTWYAIAENNGSEQPNRLRQTNISAQASQWHFESVEGGYHIYALNNSGEKQYLRMDKRYEWWSDTGTSHTSVESTTNPQTFAVIRNDDGTYTIRNTESTHDLVENYGFWGQWNNQDNRNHLTLNFTQPTTQTGQEYAVIVKDEENNKYYAVQEGGELVEVTYDERDGTVGVIVERPFAWSYTSVHDGLADNGCDQEYDQYQGNEPYNIRAIDEARAFDEGSKLPKGYYYEYLSPSKEAGTYKEDSEHPSHGGTNGAAGGAKWGNPVGYDNYHVHGVIWNGSSWVNNGQYLGADFKNHHVTGANNEADAATVFLAVYKNIPLHNTDSETVSHIDIGINATAHLEVPLAYGEYFDKDGNLVLEVESGKDVNLELSEHIDVTHKDIMDAELVARDSSGKKLDDAYYLTGTSANDATIYSDNQVRMEGSFKVSTLEPYTGWKARSNDDDQRREDRLNPENQVFYEISMTKNVTFPLVYYTEVSNPSGNPKNNGYYEYYEFEDPNSGKTVKTYKASEDTTVGSGKTYYTGVQLYGSNGKPLSVTVEKMPVEAKFSYWDERNECPPLQADWEEKNPYFAPDWWGPNDGVPEKARHHSGRNNEWWKDGAIIDNNYDIQYRQNGYPPYPGDSGMDFIVSADYVLTDQTLSIEVVKTIEDENGNRISPAKDVTNNFTLYYSDKANPDGVANGYAVPPKEAENLSDLQAGYEKDLSFNLAVGNKGRTPYFDYEVKPGMYYVVEDAAPMAEGGDNNIIVDTDGKRWKYKETRVETEYVWRDDEWSTKDRSKRHVVTWENGEGSTEGYSGVPDVLGEYKDSKGANCRNTFLEFYVYNVYEPFYGDLRIDKTVSGQGATSSEPATFVFEIKDVETDGKKYHNFASLTYTGTSPDSTTVTHIPAGIEVEVNEVTFDGCGYQVVSGNGSKATIVASDEVEAGADMASVAFENKLGPVHGHGIQNNFELTEGNKWVWNKPTVVAGDSADEQ